ncbi:hypothetical protein MTBLM5_90074 [Magnetospirillum sp. LM-5]|nr:hypothetical protein MTBLM5_90074 [Magnetospirillum sp. LM-5]
MPADFPRIRRNVPVPLRRIIGPAAEGNGWVSLHGRHVFGMILHQHSPCMADLRHRPLRIHTFGISVQVIGVRKAR